MSETLWYQGAWVAGGQLGYDGHSLDRGLQYGDGFFTTLLMINGKAVNWHRHLQRLEESAARLKFIGFNLQSLVADFQLFVDAMSTQELQVIKILVTRGFGGRGYQPQATAISATWLFQVLPYPKGGVALDDFLSPGHGYTGLGFNELEFNDLTQFSAWRIFPQQLMVSEVRYGKQPLLAGLKHLNRLENVMARQALIDTQFDDAVLLDSDGFCVSSTQANLLWIKDDTIFTPDLTTSGVKGTCLSVVIQLAERLGYQVKTGRYALKELENADEIALTNAVRGVMPVIRLDTENQSRALTTEKTTGLVYDWMKACLAD